MSLSFKVKNELLDRGYTRRNIAQIALGAAAALPFFHEFAFAQDAQPGSLARGGSDPRKFAPDVVRITSNENPMGPSKEAIEAMAQVAPRAWRYGPVGDNNDFLDLIASTEGVKPNYVTPYPGSGPALANLVPAFASPTRSWVMATPGYGNGASRNIGNKVIQVPLRKDYSHDVEAMIKCRPECGRVLHLQSQQSHRDADIEKGFRIHSGQQDRRTPFWSSTRHTSIFPVATTCPRI